MDSNNITLSRELVERLKRYIAGPEEKLRALFPLYKGNDERTLADGNMLIEVNIAAEEEEKLKSDSALRVMTHAECLEYLASIQPAEAETQAIKSSKSRKPKSQTTDN